MPQRRYILIGILVIIGLLFAILFLGNQIGLFTLDFNFGSGKNEVVKLPYNASSQVVVNFKVLNQSDKQPVADAKVTVKSYHLCSPAQVVGNECTPETWLLHTDNEGDTTFDKLGGPLDLMITIEKDGFQTRTEPIITSETEIEEDTIERTITLTPL